MYSDKEFKNAYEVWCSYFVKVKKLDIKGNPYIEYDISPALQSWNDRQEAWYKYVDIRESKPLGYHQEVDLAKQRARKSKKNVAK